MRWDNGRAVLKVLADTFKMLSLQIEDLDREIERRAKTDPVRDRLMTIPGAGPDAATAFTAHVPAAETFKCGRDLSVWLGLPSCKGRPAASRSLAPCPFAESDPCAAC